MVDFVGFMVEDGGIIAGALYVLGVFMKKTPKIPDWAIPFILAILGILAAGFSMKDGFTVRNIMQGIFAAGAAVLVNQGVKQGTKAEIKNMNE